MAYPFPQIETSLTGNVRARPGWFGRQILQVEVCYTPYDRCPPPPGCKDVQEWRQQMAGIPWWGWRDAKWWDLTNPDLILNTQRKVR